jgi:hypothetical protein
VAAGKCCRPTELGGLGVIDLRQAGFALRVRWLWLRRSDQHRTSWSLLPEDSERPVLAVFQATTTRLGNGESTLFWTDNWIGGSSIRALAPAVFGAVPKRCHATLVSAALRGRAWVGQIKGPRSMRLINEFLRLWPVLEQMQLLPGVPDAFSWPWSSDGTYFVASAYGGMFLGSSSPLGAKLIWKIAAPPHRGCGSSSGWCCMGAAGRRTGGIDLGCRPLILVSFAIRQPKLWITFSWAVCLVERCGRWHCGTGASLTSFRLLKRTQWSGGQQPEKGFQRSYDGASTPSSCSWVGSIGSGGTRGLSTRKACVPRF